MAIVKAGGLVPTALSILLVVLFVAVMIFWIKPRIPRWLGHTALEAGTPAKGVMAAVVVFLFACAFVTDVIGTPRPVRFVPGRHRDALAR